MKWSAEVDLWTTEINNDVGVLKQVRVFIAQLQTPFGFLMKEVRSIQSSLVLEEEKERQEELEGDHRYHEKEQMLKAQFDDRAS